MKKNPNDALLWVQARDGRLKPRIHPRSGGGGGLHWRLQKWRLDVAPDKLAGAATTTRTMRKYGATPEALAFTGEVTRSWRGNPATARHMHGHELCDMEGRRRRPGVFETKALKKIYYQAENIPLNTIGITHPILPVVGDGISCY